MSVAVGDEFPQLCETCLGPNPYVRMVKLRFGDRSCKISTLPYQAFKWKAGSGGRMKETVVSYAVAKERDICQACLKDMKYGLPVGLRDKLLTQVANQQLTLPTSAVGLRYQYQGGDSGGSGVEGSMGLLEYGRSVALDPAMQQAALQLDVFARARANIESRSKTAFQNLPKLCSFWVKGSCTQVLRKVCQFRPCCGQFAFPEIASDREMHAALVERLEKEGPAEVMTSLDTATREALKNSGVGINRDDAIRKRVLGQDDLSKKYLGQLKDKNTKLDPPHDTSITTLWVGRLDESVSESDVRDAIISFLPPGVTAQQINVHILRQAKCAFLQFESRDVAEAVALRVQRKLMVAGNVCPFDWAKPKTTDSGSGPNEGERGVKRARTEMPPPPGLESAPVSAYSLQGMPVPVVSAGVKVPTADS